MKKSITIIVAAAENINKDYDSKINEAKKTIDKKINKFFTR